MSEYEQRLRGGEGSEELAAFSVSVAGDWAVAIAQGEGLTGRVLAGPVCITSEEARCMAAALLVAAEASEAVE